MSRVHHVAILLTCLGAALTAGSARAGEASNSLPVSATVSASCTLTTSPMMFGNAAILSGTLDSTSSLSLRCPPSTSFGISIDNGKNYNRQRRMASDPGAFPFFRYVNYEVYKDAARTQVWGSSAGRTMVGTIPRGGTVTMTMYGRVPAAIILPTAYRDTLTVTVDF
jgi:spore coat protein U-like protein